MGWLALLLSAFAGDLVAEVSVDSLTATPRRTTGEVELATELGMRLRADLRELSDRLRVRVDYRGREPLVGGNTTHRLLYFAVVDHELVENRLSVGLGRFLAPSTVLLPVDGLRATLSFDKATSVSLFGGRRAISTSRVNLGLDPMLPAVGLSVDHLTQRLQLHGVLAYAGDRIRVVQGATTDSTADVNALNGLLRTTVLPSDEWVVGAQLSFAQQASYAIGPTWAEVTTQAEAFDWFSGLAYAYYSPRPFLRFDADVHHQSVQVFFAGLETSDGFEASLQEPNHTDVRVRAGANAWQRGWVRAEGRFRTRPDRQEIRAGLRGDLDNLGIPGVLLRARIFVDNILGSAPKDNVGAIDRLVGSASGGWRGHGLEAEAGVSFIERAATPQSGLTSDLAQPSAPTEPLDLGPFVLEAQNIVFVRSFYTHKRWFVGVDFESNLQDGEVRAFVQAGALADVRW